MFAYCRNNPVRRIDVTGFYDLDCDDADPIDDEIVHEEGFLSGGNNTALNNAANHQIDSYNYQGTNGKTEIHHIVEQCQTPKSGFDNSQIQSSSNKIELDYALHRAISGYYSSKQDFTDGLRVRDWLAGKSFEYQTDFGWRVINHHYSLQR